MTRVKEWLGLSGRFFWPMMGGLWAIYGIYRLIHKDGYVLPIMAIGSGITVAIILFAKVKCSNCGNPVPFERYYAYMADRQQFTCSLCGARDKLPGWNWFFLHVIMLVWGALLFGSVFHWLGLDIMTVILDGTYFFNAILLLLVRFSHYEKLEKI